MLGLMQDFPLLVHRALDHAARWHGRVEIVSRSVEGPLHRTTYAKLDIRSRALASALQNRLGISPGEIVGTMAWNTWRHLEIWYAVMGQGAIVHTLNPRLFTDHLLYIINHAKDRWIFTDLSFVPLLEQLQDDLPTVKGFVIMTDADHMPKNTRLRHAVCYEELLAQGDDGFIWPELDEKTACGLCYTSGTTGHPKGVLYSHRSNMLHAMMCCLADTMGISSRDCVLPAVPMFHANAWSLAFSPLAAGAKLVLPGPKLDGAALFELLNAEQVTMSAAVPTIWLALLQHLEKHRALRLPHLNRVAIGGAACPEPLMRIFAETYGTKIIHGWGMTEMSPLGTLAVPTAETQKMEAEDWWTLKVKQGRPPFLVDLKITDEKGHALPHDGKAVGHLKVRGAAVASAYFREEDRSAFDADGWFDTGDIATIDRFGFMTITDRAKDLIKSGGEWISSVDLENAAMSCDGVQEAAAIGLPHMKWNERPLLLVVRQPGSKVSREEILAQLEVRVARWWIPDDVLFVDELPRTAVGKVSKLVLRERFRDYRFPDEREETVS